MMEKLNLFTQSQFFAMPFCESVGIELGERRR